MKTKVQRLLIEAGISQAELSRQLKITQKALVDKVKGRKDFKLKEAITVCDILQISNPRDLLD